MNRFVLILLGCILSGSIIAQDKIYKKDSEVLDCKVVEIGLDVVKYLEANMEDGPIVVLSIDHIQKIVLGNGREIKFKDPLTDPISYTDDKKSAIKLHFLSPLMEHLSFSYEKSLKPGRSIESDFGLIGMGFDTDLYNKSRGIVVGTEYKFLKTPDFYSQRMKYAHILKGAYVKPQILFSVYRNEYEEEFYNGNGVSTREFSQDIVAGALVVNVGKQIVFDNLFLVDYSIGLGYGFSSQKDDFGEYGTRFRANHYGYLVVDNQAPLAITAKLKIGFLW